MFTVGPTFFSRSLGDHPPGDGLTRLQVAFAGSSAADVSGFAVPHSQSGGTLGDGYYDIAIATPGGVNPGISYDSNDIARQASGGLLTVEFFLELRSPYTTGQNAGGQTHVYLNNLTSLMQGGNNPIQIKTQGSGSFANVQIANTGSAYANWLGGELTPTLLGLKRHIALVWYADNTYAMYYNGVRMVGPTADTTYLLGSPTPTLRLGSPLSRRLLDQHDHAVHGCPSSPRIHVLWRQLHTASIARRLGTTMTHSQFTRYSGTGHER